MYSFIGRRSKLEPDLPFDRKPLKLFQKVGRCKRRKTSGLLKYCYYISFSFNMLISNQPLHLFYICKTVSCHFYFLNNSMKH